MIKSWGKDGDNMISNFLSKENVTLLLSILGIAGSASSWLYTIIKSRKRFEVRINGYRANAHGVLLHVQLINKSTLALSIGNISICSGKEYPANPLPAKVLSRTHRVGDEVKSHKEYYSMSFPVNLPPLCGVSGYLYFSSGEEIFPQLSNNVTLIVHTNRGREVKKTLPLGNLLN